MNSTPTMAMMRSFPNLMPSPYHHLYHQYRGLSTLPPLGPYAAQAAHAHLAQQHLQQYQSSGHSPNHSNTTGSSPTHSDVEIKAESDGATSSDQQCSPTGSPPTSNGLRSFFLFYRSSERVLTHLFSRLIVQSTIC